MLNPIAQRRLQKEIQAGPHPGLTIRVWCAVTSTIQFDTKEIAASTTELARIADMSVAEASRAMTRLQELGAVHRRAPGRFTVNPELCWRGSQAKRRLAVLEHAAA